MLKNKNIVPDELTTMFGKSLYTGYDLTRVIIDNTPIFRTPVGREVSPYFRRAAIEFITEINAKEVNNLEAEFRPNKSGNYHHLQLCYNKQLVITINHLSSINGEKQIIPREAIFRKMLSNNNPLQIELFPTSPENYFADGQKIHAILTHEGREYPERAALIVLNPQCNNILESLPINIPRENVNSDEHIIKGIWPDFIEFLKGKPKGSK